MKLINLRNADVKEVIKKAEEYHMTNRLFNMINLETISLDEFMELLKYVDKNMIACDYSELKFDFEGRDEDFIKIQEHLNTIKVGYYNEHSKKVTRFASHIPTNEETLIKVCRLEKYNIHDIILKHLHYTIPDKLKWFIFECIVDGSIEFRSNAFGDNWYYLYLASNITEDMLRYLIFNNKEYIIEYVDSELRNKVLNSPDVLLYRTRRCRLWGVNRSNIDIDLCRALFIGNMSYDESIDQIHNFIRVIKQDSVCVTMALTNGALKHHGRSISYCRKIIDALLSVELSEEQIFYVLRNTWYTDNKLLLLNHLKENNIELFERIIRTNRDNNGRRIFDDPVYEFKSVVKQFGQKIYFKYIKDSIWYSEEEKSDMNEYYIENITEQEFIEMFE